MFGKYLHWFELRHLAAGAFAISALQKTEDFKPGQDKKLPDAVAIQRCSKMVRKKMMEIGAPGMVVGVSVNGRNVWTHGFGYADIENGVCCKSDTVMRIASISKSITMALVGHLYEEGKLDLDKPVEQYVPEFPKKTYDGQAVTLTTRMLLSHTSGLRHYKKKASAGQDSKNDADEFDHLEYFSMKHYKSVTDALGMFKDDVLFHAPGQKYLYTTHGWTLVSAVAEKAAGEDFLSLMEKTIKRLGMDQTSAESATDIVYNRARQYVRNAKGRLENVPYVDNSYKWAGGGFLSNVPDLVKFGNIMLYSFQRAEKYDETSEILPGFLKRSTIQEMWRPIATPGSKKGRLRDNEHYGMGWFVYPEINEVGCGRHRDFEVAHTGGAIGGSSILYVCPVNEEVAIKPPQGVVVAILTNLQSVNLTELARAVASEFK